MPHTEHTTIHIHPSAPAKVAVGAPCNGCGVCCAYAPCPLGMVLSGRRSGACDALRWDAAHVQYRCGALVAPQAVLTAALPVGLRWLAAPLAPMLRGAGRRWIAAGVGCDSTLEVRPPQAVSTTMPATELPPATPAVLRPTEPP